MCREGWVCFKPDCPSASGEDSPRYQPAQGHPRGQVQAGKSFSDPSCCSEPLLTLSPAPPELPGLYSLLLHRASMVGADGGDQSYLWGSPLLTPSSPQPTGSAAKSSALHIAPHSILSSSARSPSILLLCPCSGQPGLAAPRLVAGAVVGASAWQHQSVDESGTGWAAWGRL